jgi:hypothetical protein
MSYQIWVPTSFLMLFGTKWFLPTRWKDKNVYNW